MSDDFNFIYSQQFRDHMERLNRQFANMPHMRRATEIALESAPTSRYQGVVSAYVKANTPEFSREVLSALAQTRSGPSQAVVERLVERLRANPPAIPKFPTIPSSTLTALSGMIVESTTIGSQYDTATIQALFEQVQHTREAHDEDVRPELEGVVVEEFEAIPYSVRQTLTPQQARLLKEVIRYLLISTFVCLYLTAQEGTELWKLAANIVAAYGVFDGRVSNLVDGMADWADTPEVEEGSTTFED